MRRTSRDLLLPMAMFVTTTIGEGQSTPRLADPHRVRLAEAFRLADRVRAEVWPGWERTPMAVLLVAVSTEYLVGHLRPTSEFTSLGRDALLGRDVLVRPRRFSPTLLATFPAVGGLSTIVVGSAENTGKSSVEWVLTLLHEHFHQWQTSLPDYYARADALGLARGDTTGQWMLDYPFPYDSAPVQRAVKALATSLARRDTLEAVAQRHEALRRVLSPDDARYLEFQLWQEGVARYLEIAVAEAAARADEPSEAFRRLPDYESYSDVAKRLRRRLESELAELSLGKARRVAFYPIGAALAALLERSGEKWKEGYQQHPFALLPP